jgi:hypothetical protein
LSAENINIGKEKEEISMENDDNASQDGDIF